MQAGAQAGIHSARTDGQPLMRTPAINARNFARSSALFKRLPDLRDEVNALRRELNELKAALADRK